MSFQNPVSIRNGLASFAEFSLKNVYLSSISCLPPSANQWSIGAVYQFLYSNVSRYCYVDAYQTNIQMSLQLGASFPV